MAWLGTYAKRRKFTISPAGKVTDDLTNFPVALVLDSSAGLSSADVSDIFTDIGSSYQKLSVTSSDGTTELEVDVDLWDNAATSAVLHFLAPSISSSVDTDFYLYWDSSQNDNTKVAQYNANVWSSFALVCHFSEDPSAGTLHNSASASNGTVGGTMASGQLVDGLIGKGWNFDGSSDYVDFGDLFYTDVLTYEVVFNQDQTSDQNMMLHQRNNAGGVSGGNVRGAQFFAQTKMQSDFFDAAGATILTQTSNTTLSAGTHYYGALYTGGASTTADTGLWLNDASDLTPNNRNSTVISDTSQPLQLASRVGNVDARYFDGVISELRLSLSRRSDAWMEATYHTLFDNLVTYASSPESYVSSGGGGRPRWGDAAAYRAAMRRRIKEIERLAKEIPEEQLTEDVKEEIRDVVEYAQDLDRLIGRVGTSHVIGDDAVHSSLAAAEEQLRLVTLAMQRRDAEERAARLGVLRNELEIRYKDLEHIADTLEAEAENMRLEVEIASLYAAYSEYADLRVRLTRERQINAASRKKKLVALLYDRYRKQLPN